MGIFYIWPIYYCLLTNGKNIGEIPEKNENKTRNYKKNVLL
jgi:hypothetical protein